jgi:hypothetical protein
MKGSKRLSTGGWKSILSFQVRLQKRDLLYLLLTGSGFERNMLGSGIPCRFV